MTSRDKRELEERRKIDVTQHANDPGGYLNFCKENFFRDFKQNFRHPPTRKPRHTPKTFCSITMDFVPFFAHLRSLHLVHRKNKKFKIAALKKLFQKAFSFN